MDINLLFIAYSRFDNIQNNLDNLDLDTFKEILIYIDGPKNEEIKKLQIDFVKNFNQKVKIKTHEKNLGVRGFIPFAISDSFKYSNNLLILEDDIVINNTSLDFARLNYRFLDNYMLSLFNPIELSTNFIIPDGGIWGWCVSKRVWSNFNWSKVGIFEIFYTLFNKIGLIKSLFYTPLIYLSKENKIKSWAYNWLYIRTELNIKSIIPHKTMALNVGLGDLYASNTKRVHKFSNLKLSNEISELTSSDSFPLNNNIGYSYLITFLRIFYNFLFISTQVCVRIFIFPPTGQWP